MKLLIRYPFCMAAALYCAFSNAITISANTTQRVSGSQSFSKVDGNSTIVITLYRPAGANNPSDLPSPAELRNQYSSFDCPSAYVPIEFKAFIPAAGGEITSQFEDKGSCKRVSVSYERHSSFAVRWQLYNTTTTTQQLQLYAYWIGPDRAEAASITIPANSTCSATINNVDLGNIKSGEINTSSSITATISGTATSKSMLISSPFDYSSDGILNLGGADSQVKVYPTDSNNKSGSNWVMPSSGTLPLTVDATSGVRGKWSSSLLVSLNCS